jgi:alpha-N-arabinofuranosidase
VTNLDPERAAQLNVAIEGVSVRSGTGETLTAPRINAINSFDAPDAVRPQPMTAQARGGRLNLTLPSKSVTVLRLTEGRN